MTPRYGYFLTTGDTTTEDGEKRILAIISDGSPQYGHRDVSVLTLETFTLGTPYSAIRRWYKKMKQEKPWEPRH